MSKELSSYRQIFKSTSIFGGVQVFNIIILVIRSKIIALLLGPTGIGIEGLYHSTTSLIAGITNFGLETSSVKNVAAANASGNSKYLATIVTVLRRLVWGTGILGALVTLFLAPTLSQITFGSKDYTLGFLWISVTLLLNQISIGQTVLLRGMRQIKLMARSSLSGSIIGLIVSVPIYYYWGVDGIVPAIIATSIAALLRTWYFASKIKLEKVNVNSKTTLIEGKEMLTMGFMLSISGIYVLAKSYGLKVLISNMDGVAQVGLYTAGFTIVNKYVSVVFTAMATDYFPKLSAVAKNNSEANSLINQQAEIALLILSPILSIFIVFSGYIIAILYSNEFLPIKLMIQWIALGIYFKAVSWSMVYMFLAKGNSKKYLFNELLAGTVSLFLHLSGYLLGGLTGMGIGYMLGYLYYALQVYYFSKKSYEFRFEGDILKILLTQFLIGVFCFIIISFTPNPWSYLIGVVAIIVSSYLAINELERRLQLFTIIKNKFINRNE